jgi:hypothetical protein
VAFSPDSERLITIERDQIRLWTLHPGPLLYHDTTFRIEREGCILQFCIKAAFGGTEGQILAFPSQSGGIELYDLERNEIIDSVSSSALLFLPDGTLAFVNDAEEMYDSPIYRTRFSTFSADGTLFMGVGFGLSDAELYGVAL